MRWLLLVAAFYAGSDGYQLVYRHQDGVQERMTVERWGDALRLVRTYSRDVPPRRACPRVVDYFEHRADGWWYVRTDDWFSRTRTTYTPGHHWLAPVEVPGYATWRPTRGTIEALIDANGDCNAEATEALPGAGLHQAWHALYVEGTRTRLDQVLVIGGDWDNLWRETWWFADRDGLPLPVESMGWRNGTLLWHGVLERVEW